MNAADPGSQRLSDEERFDEIVADYLDAVAAGESIDEAAWLKQHSEFADALRAFFADHQRMHGALNVDENSDDLSSGDAPTIGTATDRTFHHAGRFDDYLLIDVIAKGGMGVVYRARQLSLNRVVALKMIRAGEFADTEEIQRFRAEAEAAAQLQHPGIVPIYHIGEDRGQHFFSMALVEGASLASLMKEGLKPNRAASYAMKVARAVHYAHEQGIIHRDIKPANVLVDQNDEPLVTDFGLAKRIEADSQITMSGQILGTASYMPPEQAAGNPVTPKSDVYSLGALLYALVTERPPFIGDNPMDILMEVLSNEPVPPSSHNAAISRDLETICLCCLQKDVSKRYESAKALAEDLERFLDGRPILARPVGRIEKMIRWCRRNPAYTAAILLLGLLLASPIGYTLGYRTVIQQAFRDGKVIAEVKQLDASRGDRMNLLVEARAFYESHPLDTPTQLTQQAYLDAGLAMLHYDKNDISLTDKPYFESLAQSLTALLQEQPEQVEWKSALADCHLQLARFYFRPRTSVFQNTSAVQDHLEESQRLLADILETHPNHATLLSRLAAVRADFVELPGLQAQQLAYINEAKQISPDWDAKQGIIRFEIDPTDIATTTEKLAAQLAAEAKNAESNFRLAHALLSQSPARVPDAIDAYRTAFLLRDETESIPHALLQQAFTNLTVLAETRSDDFRTISKKTWPREVIDFYYAVLGMRLATQ